MERDRDIGEREGTVENKKKAKAKSSEYCEREKKNVLLL